MNRRRGLLTLLVSILGVGCNGGGETTDAGAADAATVDGPTQDVASLDIPVTDSGAGASGLLAEAIATCTWATGCLNPEDSFGGGAPNTAVSSCLASFFTQRMSPGSNGQTRPWGVYRTCRASSSDCSQFRACMLANQAMCGAAFEWQTGIPCANGTWTCGAECSPACTPGAAACSMDNRRIEHCQDSRLRSVACADGDPGGVCVNTGAGARCVAGAIRTCTGGASGRCAGSVLTYCDRGVEATIDCAAAGQTCSETRGCQDGTACRFDVGDTCTGNTLRVCLSGNFRDIDCTTLGGTCGTLRSGRPGCVFPEGASMDGGVPADVAAVPDVGTDAGPTTETGLCNNLPVPMGVGEMMQPGSIPAATGGTIVPGHYVLTSWSVYAPDRALPMTHTTALRFNSDGTFASVDGGMRFAGTWSTSGTQLSLAVGCPITATAVFGYTAAASTLTLLDTNGGARDQRVYTLVP